MTIRQYLRYRGNRSALAAIVILLLTGAVMSPGPRNYVVRSIIGVLIAALIGAIFWGLFEIPCPNCRRSLGRIGFWVANGRMCDSSPRCPHCDMSVDQEIPAGQNK
jgi:hypothetical protein